MERKQKRTNILGVVIFAAVVAIIGFGFVATGNFRNPLNFFQGDEIRHQGGSGAPAFNNNAPDAGFTHDRPGSGGGGSGGGFPSGRSGLQGGPGSGGGPDAEDNSGIAWNQIGAVFFDLWVLSAIVACYILVQQTLASSINRFWVKKDRR
jgi:hypothetical protein